MDEVDLAKHRATFKPNLTNYGKFWADLADSLFATPTTKKRSLGTLWL